MRTTGTLNNVTINENCVRLRGKLSANQIEGDIVKTVRQVFPPHEQLCQWHHHGHRISDDQKFDRQVMIPPVLFRGGEA